MKFLAIDPSSCSLGWAVLDGRRRLASGTWRPSAAKAAADRFDQLASMVHGLVLDHLPAEAVIEVPSGGAFKLGVKTAIVYGRAIGACEATVRCLGRPVFRVPVADWKRNKGKGETEAVVRKVMGYAPATDDEADALGLGFWWADNAPWFKATHAA